MRSRAMLEKCIKRHIILHMDINKTIIQIDAAGGRTFDDVLNSNVAANVFGYVDSRNQWTAVCGPEDVHTATQLTGQSEMHTESSSSSSSSSPRTSQLVSYEEYIDKLYVAPVDMESLSIEDKNKAWKNVSRARRSATGKFTLPQEPGERFAHLVDSQRHKMLCNTLGEYHSILPSFFVLINTLCELDWPFTLIFRTFGNDLHSVLEEWMSFVHGEHVCKASEAVMRRYNTPCAEFPRTCCVYRDDCHTLLCYGPCVSSSSLKIIQSFANETQEEASSSVSENIIDNSEENHNNDKYENNDHKHNEENKVYSKCTTSSMKGNLQNASNKVCNANTKDNDQSMQDEDQCANVRNANLCASRLEHQMHALSLLPGYECAEVVDLETFNEKIVAYLAESNNVGGIVDYYPYWAQNAESRKAGKLFPIKRHEHTAHRDICNEHQCTAFVKNNNNNNDDTCAHCTASDYYYYVFFDDNLFIGDPHSIVDIRDAKSGASIVNTEIEKAYCVHVNPYLAITQESYFVDCLTECLSQQK